MDRESWRRKRRREEAEWMDGWSELEGEEKEKGGRTDERESWRRKRRRGGRENQRRAEIVRFHRALLAPSRGLCEGAPVSPRC